jgi:type VI secretion system secreted protein Hcp
VVKALDRSSPFLFQACATGKAIPEMILEVTGAAKGNKESVTRCQFRDVQVALIRPSAGGGDSLPREEIDFDFSAITAR